MPDTSADSPPNNASTDSTTTVGKGRATPTRAEREAARHRPLVPDTKEAKARARAELAAKRQKAQAGYAAGEERYLPARDQGPQRRYVRDFVDAGWHLGEVVMPALIVVVLLGLMPLPAVQYGSFAALWFFILLVIIDMVITSFRVKRAIRAKFGNAEKGLGWYAAMRSMQMRFLRMPKPQVKRGQRPS